MLTQLHQVALEHIIGGELVDQHEGHAALGIDGALLDRPQRIPLVLRHAMAMDERAVAAVDVLVRLRRQALHAECHRMGPW
jgi:hypothetical protein